MCTQKYKGVRAKVFPPQTGSDHSCAMSFWPGPVRVMMMMVNLSEEVSASVVALELCCRRAQAEGTPVCVEGWERPGTRGAPLEQANR